MKRTLHNHHRQELGILARIGADSIADAICALEDNRRSVAERCRAARALGHLGGADVEEALLRASEDRQTARAARGALRCLFRKDRTEAQQLLRDRYRQWSFDLGTADAQALALIASDPHEDMERRSKACSLLGGAGARQALPALLGILEKQEPDVARAAAHAIAEIGSRTATRRLARVLKSGAPLVVRDAALVAIRLLHDRRAIPGIAKVALNPDEPASLRVLATHALGDLGPSAVITRALLRAADSEDPRVRRAAIEALDPDPYNARLVSTVSALTHDYAEAGLGATVAAAASDKLADLYARAQAAR